MPGEPVADDMDRRLNPFRYRSDGTLTDQARQQDQTLRVVAAPAEAPLYQGPGDLPTLMVSPSLLRERAGRTDAVSEDFARVCEAPLKDTADVPEGLKGFRSAGAFSTFQERWVGDIAYVRRDLLGRFAQGLRDGASDFHTADIDQSGKFGVQ
jgi:hypothetical protein